MASGAQAAALPRKPCRKPCQSTPDIYGAITRSFHRLIPDVRGQRQMPLRAVQRFDAWLHETCSQQAASVRSTTGKDKGKPRPQKVHVVALSAIRDATSPKNSNSWIPLFRPKPPANIHTHIYDTCTCTSTVLRNAVVLSLFSPTGYYRAVTETTVLKSQKRPQSRTRPAGNGTAVPV